MLKELLINVSIGLVFATAIFAENASAPAKNSAARKAIFPFSE